MCIINRISVLTIGVCRGNAGYANGNLSALWKDRDDFIKIDDIKTQL